MKRLLRFLGWVAVLIVLFAAAGYLFPKEITVERSRLIDAPVKVVFAQINDLHNWNSWATWNQIDPDMQIEFQHGGVGSGASYTWSSENRQVGSGKLLILESVPYDSVITELHFMEQRPATGYFRFQEKEKGTEVTWGLHTNLGNNPFARWMGLLMNKWLAADFTKGLNNLNDVAQKWQHDGTYVVEPVAIPLFHYVSLRQQTDMGQISAEMGAVYGELMTFATRNNLRMAGFPYAIYHQFEGTRVDMECGLPVDRAINSEGKFLCGTFPETRCAGVEYYGDYNQLERAHTAIQQWIKTHGFQLAGPPVEVYATDPQSEPDPAKWLTRVYYPIR